MWAVGVRLLSGTSWVRVPPLEPKLLVLARVPVSASNGVAVTGKMRVQLLPRAPLSWRSTNGSAAGLYPVSSRLERDPGSNPGAKTTTDFGLTIADCGLRQLINRRSAIANSQSFRLLWRNWQRSGLLIRGSEFESLWEHQLIAAFGMRISDLKTSENY